MHSFPVTVFSLLLLATLLVAPSSARAQAAPDTETPASIEVDPSAKTEWGFLGYTYSTAMGGGHGFNLGLPILKWGSLYWQTLEMTWTSGEGSEHPEYVSVASSATIASIAGYRLPLTADSRHELRAGLGLGWMLDDDRGDCDEVSGGCTYGEFSHDYYGVNLMPELGWVWRLAPGVGIQSLRLVQAKVRLSIPLRSLRARDPGDDSTEGLAYHFCDPDALDCPWDPDQDTAWTPDMAVSISVGVGF
jgi:hypothetical protein